jgi:hypothetical protein
MGGLRSPKEIAPSLNGIGKIRYSKALRHRALMAIAVTDSRRRSASKRSADYSGLTLETEIRSLHSLAPESVAQLPTLFAESVVKSCSSVLGETSGEALVRRIGDRRIRRPDYAFSRIDSLLRGGSDTLKRSIKSSFRARVHRLYKITLGIQGQLNP